MTSKTHQQQQLDAIQRILIQSLVLLHKRGVLPLEEVVSALDSHDYSLVAGHDGEANPVLQHLIRQLQTIATASK